MRGLVGGMGATELRRVQPTERAFEGLTEGLRDPNPKIRWRHIQILDHVPDARAATAVAELLDDAVPRVRRNAAHALGCVACKPMWPANCPPTSPPTSNASPPPTPTPRSTPRPATR
jgi:hypothetical protein